MRCLIRDTNLSINWLNIEDRRDAESTGLCRHPVHPSLHTQSGLSVAGIVRSFRTPLVSESDPFFHHNGGVFPVTSREPFSMPLRSATIRRKLARLMNDNRVTLKTVSKPTR